MFTTKLLSRTFTIVMVFMLALSGVSPAFAVGTNDNFADATAISSLPFNLSTDTMMATYEPGEPYPDCGYGYQPNSVWFKYTPLTAVSLTAQSGDYYSVLAIYTGSAIDNLTKVSCRSFSPQVTLQAQANVTYYFQLSYLYPWYYGYIPFSLQITPPPQVSFWANPYDPSIFDNVNFYPSLYDPANIGIVSYAWTTSDGATSDHYDFYHQFATDGNYTVSLTATTYDGRSATANQVVQVRTRDVAISKFGIPQTAQINQTKTINVDILNKRYSDNVQVTLYKGTPGGGDVQIGTLTIYVPAKAKQATTFKFSYTFTCNDASIGKVTFKAVASIINGRDALPADNTSINTTLVNGGGCVSYP